MEQPIDKHGKCPCCRFNLDGGDIRENLSKMDVFHHKGEEVITAMAQSYGWNEEKPTRFTKLVSRDLGPDGLFWRCPFCGYTVDQKTGDRVDPRTLKPYPKEETPKEEVKKEETPLQKDPLWKELLDLQDDLPF
jgi:hypothetical protein